MNRLAIALTGTLFTSTLIAAACGARENTNSLPELLQPRANVDLVFGDPQSECAECHPQHVEEWRISPHAYAAVDPVFHAMSVVAIRQTRGNIRTFCIQCHSPVALALDSAPVYFDEVENVFKQDTRNLGPVAQQGVSCDVCHSITDVIEPVNARAVLTPNGIRRATIQDPVDNPKHASAYSPLHGESLLCGMCHEVQNRAGARLEETFSEWASSSFAQPGGKTCQGCHMPAYRGRAAIDGPEREVHRHLFVGVDVSLLAPDEFPGYYEMRDLTTELLQNTLNVRVQANAAAKKVEMWFENLAGHAVPSGATAERQMWVELIVRDASGAVVFETGTLDENGDLRDDNEKHTTRPGSDPQLVWYGQWLIDDPRILDPNSTHPVTVVPFLWQATTNWNYLIMPDTTDHREIDLSALEAGSYTASYRLLFRTFPPYFLRELERQGGLDPAVKGRVPIVTMYETQLQFQLP